MRKRIGKISILLLVLVPLLLQAVTLDQAEKAYRNLITTRKRLYRHNWERVIRLYKELLKKEKSREKALYRLYCLYNGLYSYSGRASDRKKALYYLRRYREEKKRKEPARLTPRFLKVGSGEVRLKLPDRLKLTYFFLENPSRLVMDIKPAKVVSPGRVKGKGFFRSVRFAQYRKKTVRVVLDLRRKDVVVLRKKGEVLVKPKVRKLYLYSSGIRVIVLDPGHGGRDPGAIGPSGLREKTVVLDVAKKLKRLIEEKTDIKVYLTRNSDKYVPLDERVRFAKRVNADLFISIHVNANRNKRLCGVETYYLDPRVNVARFKRRRLKGLDFILSDLIVTSNLKTSRELARSIQKEIARKTGLGDNGIKRAPFYVLLFNDIPSILIEAGYISNPREERLLANARFRHKLATAIFEGLKRYLMKRVRVLEAKWR